MGFALVPRLWLVKQALWGRNNAIDSLLRRANGMMKYGRMIAVACLLAIFTGCELFPKRQGDETTIPEATGGTSIKKPGAFFRPGKAYSLNPQAREIEKNLGMDWKGY